MSKVQKRPSELSVSAPTRTALLQIALLKPGNMFVSIQPLDRWSYPGFLERWDYVAFSRRRRQWLCKLTCSLHTTFRFPCLVMFCTERKSKRDLHGLPMYFLWLRHVIEAPKLHFCPYEHVFWFLADRGLFSCCSIFPPAGRIITSPALWPFRHAFLYFSLQGLESMMPKVTTKISSEVRHAKFFLSHPLG